MCKINEYFSLSSLNNISSSTSLLGQNSPLLIDCPWNSRICTIDDKIKHPNYFLSLYWTNIWWPASCLHSTFVTNRPTGHLEFAYYITMKYFECFISVYILIIQLDNPLSALFSSVILVPIFGKDCHFVLNRLM